MTNSLSTIQKFKIKTIKNNVNPDEFIWIINSFKKQKSIISFLKKNKIPYINKMGYLILSKIYLDLIEKINFLINTNIKFDLVESKTIDTFYDYLIKQEGFYKTHPNFMNNLTILIYEKDKIFYFDANLIEEINNFYKNSTEQRIDLDINKEELTITFKDSYNRIIEVFNTPIENPSSINKIFKVYNFEKIKIAKIIKERIIDSVISHYLEGFSINLKEYEIDIVQYSKENDDLCVQLLNTKSGKSIIIYPIVFDLNTGMISEAGQGIGQLRLI